MEVKANNIKNEIAKKFAVEFKFVNNEYDWIMTADGKEVLTYVGYRYVRVLDSRLVLGTVNQLIITLGASGNVKSVRFSNPSITEFKKVNKMIKKNVSVKRLENQLMTENSINDPIEGLIKVTDFVADQLTDSYIVDQQAGVNVLLPNLTFYGNLTYTNGKVSESHVNLKLDGDSVSNLDETDYENGTPAKF